MSVLKKMSGTEGFLGLSDAKKGCHIQDQAECEQMNYVEEVQKRCGCLPWSLAPALPSEVSPNCSFNFSFLIYRLASSALQKRAPATKE